MDVAEEVKTTSQVQSPSTPCIYLLNPTSICKKDAITHLQQDILYYNPDIVIITESWFKSHHNSDIFAIPGYNLHRRDRIKRKGGGVCLYTKSTISATVWTPSNDTRSMEVLWTRFILAGNVWAVADVYHPPPSTKSSHSERELIDYLQLCIDNLVSDTSRIVIAGDFNQVDNNAICTDLGLTNYVNCPTHLGHELDRIYASTSLPHTVHILDSAINAKHKAVLATPNQIIIKNKVQRTFRSHSPIFKLSPNS